MKSKLLTLIMIVLLALMLISTYILLNLSPPRMYVYVESKPVHGLKLEVLYSIEDHILKAKIKIVNTSNSTVEFYTRTSQVFDIIVEYENGAKDVWSSNKYFLQVLRRFRLEPGDYYSEQLFMKLKNSIKRVIFKTVELEIASTKSRIVLYAVKEY